VEPITIGTIFVFDIVWVEATVVTGVALDELRSFVETDGIILGFFLFGEISEGEEVHSGFL